MTNVTRHALARAAGLSIPAIHKKIIEGEIAANADGMIPFAEAKRWLNTPRTSPRHLEQQRRRQLRQEQAAALAALATA